MKRGRGGRDMEGKRGQEREREREREREGGPPNGLWCPWVSGCGRVGVAARAVAGVCSAHSLNVECLLGRSCVSCRLGVHVCVAEERRSTIGR